MFYNYRQQFFVESAVFDETHSAGVLITALVTGATEAACRAYSFFVRSQHHL